MKIIIALSLLFIHHHLLLAKQYGQVRVLEAPLYQMPDFRGKKVEFVRKGNILFLLPLEDTSDFYKTLDSMGNEAFIAAEVVQIIESETTENVSPTQPLKADKYDYRLVGPLPENYPLAPVGHYRAQFKWSYFSPAPLVASYPKDSASETISESADNPFGLYLNASLGKRASFDLADRLYFRGEIIYGYQSQSLQSKQFTDKNSFSFIGLGPSLSFDAFKREKWSIIADMGLFFCYAEGKITRLEKSTSSSETLTLPTFAFIPQFNLSFKWHRLFPRTNLLLVNGFSFFFSRHLAQNSADSTQLWETPPTGLHIDFTPSLHFGLGLEFIN